MIEELTSYFSTITGSGRDMIEKMKKSYRLKGDVPIIKAYLKALGAKNVINVDLWSAEAAKILAKSAQSGDFAKGKKVDIEAEDASESKTDDKGSPDEAKPEKKLSAVEKYNQKYGN